MKSIFKEVFSSESDDGLDELKRQMHLSSKANLMLNRSSSTVEFTERRLVNNGLVNTSTFNKSPFGIPNNIAGQTVFGAGVNSTPATISSRPPFNTGVMMSEMDDFNKAKILIEYLRSKGVKYINAETAKALFTKSLYIGTEKENIVKQPKKKLKF